MVLKHQAIGSGVKKNGGKVQFASYSDGAGLIGDGYIDVFAFFVGQNASIILNNVF